VKQLYAHSGRTLDAKAERRMQAWLAHRSRKPRRRYSLAEFGLDAGALSERFAPYRDIFDIKAERPLADHYAA
jgi:hypothetical protein